MANLSVMEPLDLSSVLTPDFWFQQFTNFDGVHTGVPTRTTPTLTPTTLRNIEQTFIELTRETERAEPHQNEAGFVPPVVQPVTQGKSTFMSLVDSKNWIGSTTIATNPTTHTMNRPTVVSSAVAMPFAQQTTTQSTRRNTGGRRPQKNSGISPEEEERRRIRRERNKLAAARCRKRRLDRTNELQKETDGLEQKKQSLQSEIQTLQSQKEHLEFLLEAHKANCRLAGTDAQPPSPPDVKPIIPSSYDEDSVIAPMSEPSPPKKPMLADLASCGGNKPSRPSSLPVSVFQPKPIPTTISEVAGVPITTPSAGIALNFDSLMEGGTGLTPVSGAGLISMIPSCSSQQRNSSGIDFPSPDTSYPPKLVSL